MRVLGIQHDIEVAIERILDLKSHHVRTVFIGIERDILIRGLKEGEG